MILSYFVKPGPGNNLYGRLTEGKIKYNVALNERVKPSEWSDGLAPFDDYRYSLLRYLSSYVETGKLGASLAADHDPAGAGELLASWIGEGNLTTLGQQLFDAIYSDGEMSIPKYSQFVRAFEEFIGGPATDYQISVDIEGGDVEFHKAGRVYQVTTDRSMVSSLESMADNAQLEDLYVLTNEDYWLEVFEDISLDKTTFLPAMLREWQRYWRGKNHPWPFIDKDESWQGVVTFMQCFGEEINLFKLAQSIEESLLPMVCVAALQAISLDDRFLHEYVSQEFNDEENDWTEIALTKAGDRAAVDADEIDQFYCREQVI